MLALVIAATITASWTAPAFDDSNGCAHAIRVRAHGDSVRCIVNVFPLGNVGARWSDTLYVKRGDGVWYQRPARSTQYHLLTVRTSRKRLNHIGPTEWIVNPCDSVRVPTVMLVPK